ncbi:hypothetical protein [Rhizobium leguminosarum]|jgi:hypothetical protein|uniref:hypothetical protein n=1 Tax=Rhizobium leguminosarum TaxID=384 RepID=UPI000379D038|nr:hypothetical protein [Rhizobium leguminosarum]MBY2922202.1 hypothetical protein [Rhizobium leguminosarum]MBY3032497.1 hypothetical protein [Rhizobium leguminosarum]RWX37247.1 hypothetical protein EHI43_07710 [Rhizobium leguminosarum]
MENRLHPATRCPTPFPRDEAFEKLRQRVHALLENAEASRWELLRTEWLYDVVLLTNDFRLWMQRLDKGFGTANRTALSRESGMPQVIARSPR